MIFWGLASLMTLAAVIFLLWPLKGRQAEPDDFPSSSAPAHDLAVYRDQLDEVERDLDRKVISPDEAEAARIEIKRRILEAGTREAPLTEAKSADVRVWGSNRLAAAVIAVMTPLLALGTYVWLGSPGVPGEPFADRLDSWHADAANQQAMIPEIEKRLEDNPDDQEVWLTLGHLYRRAQRLEDAAGAYRRALVLAPEWNEARVALAETLVGQGNGEVTREARRLFANVLQEDPNNPSALYYAGLALAQDGLLNEALSIWVALLRASPQGSPWIPLVTRQVQSLAVELNLDPATLEPLDEENAPALSQNQPGPSAEDMASAAEMSEEERAAFIQSMVDRLAARLTENPDDLEGWIRLTNAYRVLNQPDKALEALAAAEKLAADLPSDHQHRQMVESLKEVLSKN